MCLLSPANHTIFCTIGRENCNVFSLWLLYTIFRILLSTFSLFFILFSKIRQFCCYFFHPKSFKNLYLLYIIYNLFFFSVFYFIHSISCQNSTSCMQLNCSFCTTFQVQISIKAYFLALWTILIPFSKKHKEAAALMLHFIINATAPLFCHITIFACKTRNFVSQSPGGPTASKQLLYCYIKRVT